ncbi:microtubule-associated tumor suppressor 1 homolog isoform X2 [Mizuhopecten yessoensis]|uniref:microtubule-associated tumor suppressor 1 homolog isoform X2 n=1 Tax=Mizuhopecten yessoensis TaxID=6573 RepID=UPI000B45CFEE|nr:microtubule-associated tumor suppressor 1 homolog isoform X2 [Mizuhopecten yessoensis]
MSHDHDLTERRDKASDRMSKAHQSGLEGSPRRRKSNLPGPKTFGTAPGPSSKVAGPPDTQGAITHYQPVDSHQGLYVGQRVYIGGIKQGTVLYCGRTHLADGIFCGIELDESDGKHDGQVQGVRYFRCRPGHGIFAPLEKVSKVPDHQPDESIESHYQQALASQQRLSRRLLPQSKPYVRTGSRERIAIPTCIEEQNEDIIDSVDEAELRYLEEQLRASGSPKLGGGTQGTDIDATKCLSDTYTKEDFTIAKSSPKRSRLPAYSKLPQSRTAGYKYTDVAADIELIRKEDITIPKSLEIKDFNKTFTLSDNLPDVVDHQRPLTESSSSADDSLSTDAKECLCSDRRQYFNLTFDTGSNNSSPQHLAKDTAGLQPALPQDVTQPGDTLASSSSSLGLVDINSSHFSTDLLQGSGIDGNLTDSEKLKHTFSVSKRTDRVASLSDTFSLDHAVTSTPENKSLSRQRTEAEQESLTHGSRNSGSKRSLASTFELEHKVHPPVTTDDTLDWRQEASDGEDEDGQSNCSENIEEQQENVRQVNIEIQNVKNCTFSTVDKDGQEILIPKVGITGQELIKSSGPVEAEQLLYQRPKRPMTDSGIGLTDSCEMRRSQNMADSSEFRRSQNLESVLEDANTNGSSIGSTGDLVCSGHDLLDGHTRQNDSLLRADLEAGHFKQGRPLSLISTTSADTGYVPDTDTDIEMEGGATGSPVHWEEQHSHAQSSTSELDKAYANTFKHYQAGVTHGTVRSQVMDSDSDLYSDTGTIIPEDDTLNSSSRLLDLENMSSLLMDVEGMESKDVLPVTDGQVSSQDVVTPQEMVPVSQHPVKQTSSQMEDDRTEADQGQDVKVTESQTVTEVTEISGKEVVDKTVTDQPQDPDNDTMLKVTVEVVDDSNSAVTETEVKGEVSVTSQVEEKNEEKQNVSKDKSDTGTTKNKFKFKKKKEVEKIEYKKPNVNVKSRLGDYIKAPLPVKAKEEVRESPKPKQNTESKKKNSKEDADKSKQNSGEGVSEERNTRKKVEKEIPKIIKRSPPKSKWGNIMSQIEEEKGKVKPKSEVKSKLETYLSTPAPTPPPPKKEEATKEAKVKIKLPAVPKPDYSKVKSKLCLGPPPPIIKRDRSPSGGGRAQSPRPGRLSKGENSRRPSSVSSAGSIVPNLDLNDSLGSSVLDSALSSARSSQSETSRTSKTEEESTTPRPGGKPENPAVALIRRERRDSSSSSVSDSSQGSVKVMNAKNLKASESVPTRRKSMPVKSSIQPPMKSPKERSPAPSSSGKRLSPTDAPPTTKATNNTTNKKTGSSSRTINKPQVPNKSSTPQKQTDQSRNKSSKSKTLQKPLPTQPDPAHTKQEIARLEALCEARTKELNFAKLQMRSNLQAFDAMAALVNYLSHDLDAFSCPALSEKLQKLQTEMAEAQSQLVELQERKVKLESELEGTRHDHIETTATMQEDHKLLLTSQREKLQQEQDRAVRKTEDYYSDEITRLKAYQDKQIREVRAESKASVTEHQQQQKEDIHCLQRKHEHQMEELHKQHRDKLEDITHRFESMKMNLSDKVESLRYECDDLRVRARMSEEALQRDSDYKVQMALAPFRNMPEEIRSLKLVVEMRNEEIQKLKQRNLHLERQVEELAVMKDKVNSLHQKLENSDAILSIKSDHEKQLHGKCQILMRKYDKENKANKRLSMDYEELVWKMNQSGELGSQENLWSAGQQSPTPDTSSPGPGRRTRSPAVSESDRLVNRSPVYRRSLSSNATETDGDKKLKRRSATYLLEDRKTSPTGSPLHKRSHGSASSASSSPLHHSYHDSELSNGRTDRMIHSLNDVDVFEEPQALPSPPPPCEMEGSLTSFSSSSESDPMLGSTDCLGQNEERDNSKTLTSSKSITMPDLPFVDSDKCEEVTGQDEGVCLTEEQGEEASDMSHSTESTAYSNSSSLLWDYEKMDSAKSMDSSQTSDTLLEQNGSEAWQTESMTSSKGISASSSAECVLPTKEGKDNEGQTTQEVTTVKTLHESTV